MLLSLYVQFWAIFRGKRTGDFDRIAKVLPPGRSFSPTVNLPRVAAVLAGPSILVVRPEYADGSAFLQLIAANLAFSFRPCPDDQTSESSKPQSRDEVQHSTARCLGVYTALWEKRNCSDSCHSPTLFGVIQELICGNSEISNLLCGRSSHIVIYQLFAVLAHFVIGCGILTANRE